MILLTLDLLDRLRGNSAARLAALHDRRVEPDPAPVVKLFNPIGPGTWLATELADDGDTLFGLADLGFGFPELGSFSLAEIAGLRLPYGVGVKRDRAFASVSPLSLWAEAARHTGSIRIAEVLIARAERAHGTPPGR